MRLLPISGGTFQGEIIDRYPMMTVAAIDIAYKQMQETRQEYLKTKEIVMCIFGNDEYYLYKHAFTYYNFNDLNVESKIPRSQVASAPPIIPDFIDIQDDRDILDENAAPGTTYKERGVAPAFDEEAHGASKDWHTREDDDDWGRKQHGHFDTIFVKEFLIFTDFLIFCGYDPIQRVNQFATFLVNRFRNLSDGTGYNGYQRLNRKPPFCNAADGKKRGTDVN